MEKQFPDDSSYSNPVWQRGWRRVGSQSAQWMLVTMTPFLRGFDWDFARNATAIVLGAFVASSSLNTLLANRLIAGVTEARKAASRLELARDGGGPAAPSLHMASDAPSQRVAIIARNLFNSDGVLPAEDLAIDGGPGSKTKNLDFTKVPCNPAAALPVQVVGTVFTGDPKRSFVALKDPAIPNADIYKPGDVIIDHEEYEIFEVSRGSVIARKGDEKICVFLYEGAQGHPPKQGISSAAENTKQIEFDAGYVANEIGPGYANILNSHKLIPESVEGKSIGFKMIAINPGSLFDRAGFQNNDVLTDVNSVSLADPSQGFKVYQALQEEREVTIKFLRNGEVHVRKVLIK